MFESDECIQAIGSGVGAACELSVNKQHWSRACFVVAYRLDNQHELDG
jgi:hypothetical protein